MINKSLISDSDVDLAISGRVATQITADVHYSPFLFRFALMQLNLKFNLSCEICRKMVKDGK